jgi:hypothetical protein
MSVPATERHKAAGLVVSVPGSGYYVPDEPLDHETG